MNTKQVIAAVACVLVIAVAVVYTVKKQSPQTGPPEKMLAETHDFLCAKCGATEKMSLADWQKLPEDSATGYRKCPKCGEMGLSFASKCPHCGATIPSAPANAVGSYPCPKCGKNVLDTSGVPMNVPPAQ